MKGIVRFVFRALAGLTLRRYRPVVIGIAGSIGKTASKEAIAAALSAKQRYVRKTVGSFNGEIGVPLTILTGQAAPSGWWSWLMALGRSVGVALGRKRAYPEYLVLELGADKPGDLAMLMHIAKPQIGVLTAITPEHLEFFGDMQAVVNEESAVVLDLPADGQAVINIDEPNAAAVAKQVPERVIAYGWSPRATIRAVRSTAPLSDRGLPTGMQVSIRMDNQEQQISLPGVFGQHSVYPVLAALAVGQIVGISTPELVEGLQDYQPPPGRMRLLEGLEGTLLIDDSYNASPAAMQAGLDAVAGMQLPGRTFAILGQMSELGSDAALWHDRIGRKLTPDRIYGLITVGPLAERIGAAAKKKGLPEDRIWNVPNAEAAALLIRPMLQSGDAIYVKGSRYASRLERTVRLLLHNPARDLSKLVPSA